MIEFCTKKGIICEQSDLKRGIPPKCLFEVAFFEVTKINLYEYLRQSMGPKIGFFSQFDYGWHFLPLVQIFYVECTQIKRHQ